MSRNRHTSSPLARGPRYEPFIPSATKAIDLEEFVDLADIDPVFYDTPYIVAPDKSAKPYVLLTKAMEEAGKVAGAVLALLSLVTSVLVLLGVPATPLLIDIIAPGFKIGAHV